MGRKRTSVESIEALIPQEDNKIFRLQKFYKFLNETSRNCQVVCLYGGAGSGKSESICQELVWRLFNEDFVYILIVRRSGPSLTASTYDMVRRIVREFGFVEGVDFDINKTEKTIRTRDTHSVMLFKPLDDYEKLKSLNLNYIYLEEATEVTHEDFAQLTFRARNRNRKGYANQVIISFNPVSPYHWTKLKIVDKADIIERSDYTRRDENGDYVVNTIYNSKTPYIAVQHSTYLDNPFVEYGQTIDNYKENDDSLFQIYGLGEFIQMKNLIYTRYNIVPSMPLRPPTVMGLDFGWHRTALEAIWHDEQTYELYIKDIIYEEKLTTADIMHKLDELPPSWRFVSIYADSADPDRIEEMQRHGYPVEPAKKDVRAGIDVVKRFYLHIDENSIGILKELPTYKWKEKGGAILDEPVKINDHALDGVRYGVFSSCIADFITQEVFTTKTIDSLELEKSPIPKFDFEDLMLQGYIPQMY
jgi:phage terminase large subunit